MEVVSPPPPYSLPHSKCETEGVVSPPPCFLSRLKRETVVSPPPPYPLACSKHETKGVVSPPLPLSLQMSDGWSCLPSTTSILPPLLKTQDGCSSFSITTLSPHSKRKTEGGFLSTTTLLPPSLQMQDGGGCLPSTTSLLSPSLQMQDGGVPPPPPWRGFTTATTSLHTQDGGVLPLSPLPCFKRKMKGLDACFRGSDYPLPATTISPTPSSLEMSDGGAVSRFTPSSPSLTRNARAARQRGLLLFHHLPTPFLTQNARLLLVYY